MRKDESPAAGASGALTVSQLSRQVKGLLETSFMEVQVEGEISGLSRPASGHWYFTLKDERAQIRCAMFRNRNRLLKQPPTDGEQVLIRAKVSLYEARGDFQLIVEAIEPAGRGALQRAFEELKARLEREGLFAMAHKQQVPVPPRHLGLVTSATGAAIRDILTVLNRRFPGLPITLYPTPVQGADATAGIVAAIERAHRHGRCDALIVGRGGGSLEDLWCFNEEAVARAIFNSRIPIISAVGHEVDVTIADLVADQRAPTPSAAAEAISPNRQEFLDRLSGLEERLILGARQLLQKRGDRLSELHQRLRHPRQQLQEQAQRLDELEARLHQQTRRHLGQLQEQLSQYWRRLTAVRPEHRLRLAREQVSDNRERLERAMRARLERDRERTSSLGAQLDLVSPLATLNRGYAIAQDERGTIVRRAEQRAPGDAILVRLGKGALDCRVETVKTDDENP
ncbi:exodeoxyribonuclease VII large subunit [Vreelandella utahensis]|uniref:exodeoxyribonuclease VII large subunit n=1 Tax=Vreelandella halophila TaxID=86177 RepID=UPI00098423C3|nr:exodeoxyribonuclease VII large subunit [Halomonas utahensis]